MHQGHCLALLLLWAWLGANPDSHPAPKDPSSTPRTDDPMSSQRLPAPHSPPLRHACLQHGGTQLHLTDAQHTAEIPAPR